MPSTVIFGPLGISLTGRWEPDGGTGDQATARRFETGAVQPQVER
jgi:hypothetical protein